MCRERDDLRATVARLTAELERAKGHAARWKALAKDVHRLWVRRPAYEPETMRLLGMGPTASGGFEIRVSATQAVRNMADAFFELLQMHNAPNCVETEFTTSKGVHVSVEVRRHDGKWMADLRAEAVAERDALAAQVTTLTAERDEARGLLGDAAERGLADCVNMPECDDPDEPMARAEWCQFCDVRNRIAAHLGAK